MSIYYDFKVFCLAKNAQAIANLLHLDECFTKTFEFSYGGSKRPELSINEIALKNPEIILFQTIFIENEAIYLNMHKHNVEKNKVEIINLFCSRINCLHRDRITQSNMYH